MIVRMSKIEIVGEKELLEDALVLLHRLCIFQIEPVIVGHIEKDCQDHVRPFVPDEKALSEMIFLQDLMAKIDELFSFLPHIPPRKSYLEVPAVIDTISTTIQKHLDECRDLNKRLSTLRGESGELLKYDVFLRTVSPLLDEVPRLSDLDFIGLTIKDPSLITSLRGVISRLTDWKYELLTESAQDGTLVGLIMIERQDAERVKKVLSDEQIPEFPFPPSLKDLPFSEKLSYIGRRIVAVNTETEEVQRRLREFSQRWMPLYLKVREWIVEKLSLFRTTAAVFETRMCFCVIGWMPSSEVGRLRQALAETFHDRVVLEEKEILEGDIERIPVALKNPPYLEPFELLVKLLPLPRYTSYDPTPFIGIFFPLFFGMILGDAGYGAVLVLLSVMMIRRFRRKREIMNAGKILLVSGSSSILFGILYGELFGQLGRDFIGLEPLFIERSHAVVPMLCFAIAVGFVHVVLGLFLGILSAARKRAGKEAAFRAVQILLIFFVIALFLSFIRPFPWPVGQPLTILIVLTIPFLLFTGGILAPLEFLKNIGNIISYARIMAIGLASVLLAFVANRFAGLTGDFITGIIVAGMLHTVNLVLGVFSPTIHSLRLHYVEFFSKFIEQGGRKFEPLRKGK